MAKKSLDVYALQLKFQNQAREIERLILTLSSLFSKEASKVYSSDTNRFLDKDPYLKARVQIHRYHTLTTLFPNMVWSSTFLTIYSALEHCLDDFCNIMQKDNSLAISVRELKDNGIKRSETYLSKIAQIKFPSDSVEWKEIKSAREVRNCLAHAAGNLKDATNKSQIEKIVAKDPRLQIQDGHLIITIEYVLGFLSSTRTVISTLTGISSSFHKL